MSSSDRVNHEIHSFYHQLYFLDDNCHSEFPVELPSGLSSEESSSLTKPIKPCDIITVVKTLPNNKYPGLAGIPYEFFKKNLRQLMKILIPMFNGMISNSSIIPDSGNVITVLLYKKGDQSELKNWLPIALSKADSKILSKIMAVRIGKLMRSHILPQQFGFVPNQSIWDNIFQVNNVILSSQSKGALTFLDQEKAYY